MTDQKMTAKERSDLQALARMNARVSKADVDALMADRVAAFEAELQREWTAQELQVGEMVELINAQVAEINATIERQCEEQGIRPELRPRMLAGLVARSHLSKERYAELRRLSKLEVEAAGRRAKVEIDRQTAAICTEIIASSITSVEAQAILARVDTPQQLVPAFTVAELEARIGGVR